VHERCSGVVLNMLIKRQHHALFLPGQLCCCCFPIRCLSLLPMSLQDAQDLSHQQSATAEL
jgi:hypothetical protein